MFWKLSLIAIAVMFIGSGLGVTAYAWQDGTFQEVARPLVAAWTTPSKPTTPQVDKIGSEYRLAAPKGQTVRPLWVNRTAVDLFNRAYADGDERKQLAIVRLYESIDVLDGTRVRVVASELGAFQLQVLEGPLQGRRGWTNYAVALPEPTP